MAVHTIKEAVTLTGKSRKTIYARMNAGQLSYTTGTDQRRMIDTCELIRVFGELSPITHQETLPITQVETGNNEVVTLLKKQIAMLEHQLGRAEGTIDQLNAGLEHLQPGDKKLERRGLFGRVRAGVVEALR